MFVNINSKDHNFAMFIPIIVHSLDAFSLHFVQHINLTMNRILLPIGLIKIMITHFKYSNQKFDKQFI